MPEAIISTMPFEILMRYRYTLTIEEAARYYHIGEAKIRRLVEEHPNEDFYILNGNRILIKREKFEKFLDQMTVM